ncbi:MAG TPA: outer membrane beta-barrel protein [Blastocatellia bacterium]|nr:outer membrane beta-barrel protein [Blastocatellia bacterium]
MFLNFRRFVAVICMLAASSIIPATGLARQTAQAKAGKIEGAVYNVASGEPLLKARVEVVGKTVSAETGVDGAYSISIEPGTYAVRFVRDGFIEQTIDDVTVQPGALKELNAVLSPVGHGESVMVTASNSDQVAAMIEDRKSATTVQDTISAREISKDTASSAAGVVQRAPGVSVVNDFVYVRGLGERYSNTSLNDALLPTTEPDRKVVPMDLIPANLLQNIRILKTFTPDQPGEFSGGLVSLETIEFPKATSLSVSFSMGFNTVTHGENFLGYQGGGTRDFFGFGRSARKRPATIPDDRRVAPITIINPEGFTPEQLEAIGESFENIWDPRDDSARPDVGWSISGGRSFGKFGMVGALSFKNELQSLDEVRNFYQIVDVGVIRPGNQYEYTSSQMAARLGGAVNLSYQLTPNNRFYFKNFLTNQATDEARIFEGFNEDRGTDFFNTRLRYIEERIYTGQVSGNHVVDWLRDSIFTWRYTYSRATLDEPDLRESLYEFNPSAGDFTYLNQTQSLFRMFNDMRENVREPAFDLAKFWFFSSVSLNTKLGASYINRDRVFDSRRFRFTPRGLAGLDLTRRPEQLVIPENIEGDRGFEIREETRPTDHYDALQNIVAGYLMGDITLKKWRLIGGARVETSEQRVTTFEPFNPISAPVLAELKDTDILPSLGIAYAIMNGSMNLRFGFSRTVARPQFRELAPFEFTDVTGGRATVGNPELVRTLITNYDLRWEWFFAPTQLIAVSAFHKDLKDPIENVVEATAALRTTFRNVNKARNTGVEVETRKNLGDFWDRFQGLSLNANYTYVRSRVDIGEENRLVLTNIERPLVGQAGNIVNLILDYEIPRFDAEARALYNFTGDRISDVGAFGLPDIIEHSYPHLDLLFAKRFGGERKWRAEFTAENVLNRRVDFRQADQAFRVYRPGRRFSFGVSYTIF